MELGNKWRITYDRFGYTVTEHIFTTKKVDGVEVPYDYWGNDKYPGTLAQCRDFILERTVGEFVENGEIVEFVNAMGKIEELKNEIMNLSATEEPRVKVKKKAKAEVENEVEDEYDS